MRGGMPICFSSITLIIEDFITSALADGFPLESEWQQLSSSLLVTLQYAGISKHIVGLRMLSYFQVL